MDKRKSERTGITAVIKLRQLEDHFTSGIAINGIQVDVVNISKDGIGFKTLEYLRLNTLYDTVINLNGYGSFEAIIEVVRSNNYGEAFITYGARFIGINSEDRARIDVYQTLYKNKQL